MGILKSQPDTDNILTRNGFEYRTNSVDGVLPNCFQKRITLSNTYTAFVAVNIITLECHIYVEFECGGEVDTFNFTMPIPFERDEKHFFNCLDSKVTHCVKRYTE